MSSASSPAAPPPDILATLAGLPEDARRAAYAKLRARGVDLRRLPIRALEEGDEAPLSHAQERLWFLWHLDPSSPSYTIAHAVHFSGRLHVAALEGAFAALVARHAILRTTFVATPEGEGRQRIHARMAVPLERIDLSASDPAAREESLAGLMAAQAAMPFDLERGPLLRLCLVDCGTDRHTLILAMHHIVSDAWSTSVLLREFADAYRMLDAGAPVSLPPLAIQYRDYAVWQKRLLAAGEGERQLAYWRELLGARQPVLELSADHARTPAPTHPAATVPFRLDPDLAEALRALARRQGATLFMVLLAAFQALLFRLTGAQDVRVGVPTAGRTRPETEPLVGFFVNTQVLAATLAPDLPFASLLDQVKAAVAAAQDHQDLPFERLVEALKCEREASRHPLFQVMFNHQRAASDARSLQLPGLDVAFAHIEAPTTKFDLDLDVVEGPAGLDCRLTYARDLFAGEAADALARRWRCVLTAVAAAPATVLRDLPLMADDEAAGLVAAAAGPERALPELFFPEAFAAVARAGASRPALRQGDVELSYGELEARAERLAQRLRARGVGPEVRVGLALARTPELVVALLAVLKAGGAYVPLDPALPAERIAFMIADSAPALVLTQGALAAELAAAAGPAPSLLCLDRAQEEPEALPLPAAVVRGETLSYCIYTSGSTGRPKAAAITHRGLMNYLLAARDRYALDGSWAPVHGPLSFDATITSVLLPLLQGQTLVLLPEADTLEALAAELDTAARAGQPASVLKITPAHLAGLSALMEPQRLAGSARAIVIGGEALSRHQAAPVLGGPAQAINEYGPTETVVGCCVAVLDAATVPQADGTLPIGAPLSNMEMLLLDADLRAVPPGVVGEIYIGGPGLARGYLGRPGLTADRFVPHPFPRRPGERLYRTGDLGRRRFDGSLEYHGRRDGQVKLRGFRVELGEIEAALAGTPGVVAAVASVMAGQTGPQLVAHVVPAAPFSPEDAERLRGLLRARLPDYMVPAHILPLERLPLTANGKVDRSALPAPQVAPAGDTAPRTAVETSLAAIWCAVLGRERVGIHDNFFALGGDSILGLQIVARARQQGLALTVRNIFEGQSVAELALLARGCGGVQDALAPLADLTDEERDGLDAAALEDAYPLSPLQKGMLFHALEAPEEGHYVNQLSAAASGLDLDRLAAAWAAAAQRHPVLRTGFGWDGPRPLQRVHRAVPSALEVLDWRGRPVADAEIAALCAAQRVRGFDLAAPPLQRLVVVRLDAGRDHLIWTWHHLILDGWSSARLLEEVFAGYRGEEVEASPGRFRDYVAWVESRDPAAGEAYWRAELAACEGPTRLADALAGDHPPTGATGHGFIARRLTPEASARLSAFARDQRLTLNTLVEAAFGLVLRRLSGQATVTFGETVAGRPPELPGVERTLGLFINTVPVVQSPPPAQPARAWLATRQAAAVARAEHGHLPLYALQRWAGRPGEALFDCLLVFENYPVDLALRERSALDLKFEQVETVDVTTYPLTLSVRARSGLELEFAFARNAFTATRIETVLDLLLATLDDLVAEPERCVGLLPRLPAAVDAAVMAWGRGAGDGAAAQCLHELVEAQAGRAPAAVAVRGAEGELTYGALERRANQLAWYLKAQGVGPEVMVGLCLPRSFSRIVGLLAILKAGGAYVPLDAAYPLDRLAFMAADSGLRLILTTDELADTLFATVAWAEAMQAGGAGPVALCRLDGEGERIAGLPAVRPPPAVGPENLAYCIYTSGSTGRPKGVANTHRGIVNHERWIVGELEVAPGDRVLHHASLSFDAAIFEYWTPLVAGGCCVLSDVSSREDASRLEGEIARAGITLLQAVPSVLEVLLETAAPRALASLRAVYLGGEALPPALPPRFLAGCGATLYNSYGPTEAAVDVSLWRCEAVASDNVPIGRPIRNMRLFILDEMLEPVPPGVAGELHVAGPGLARGYWRRSGATAERFVPNPFADRPGERLYATGDLARWRADGAIAYLGRKDSQVKVHGFRIELAEIEACLRTHPDVRDAAVAAKTQGAGRQLVAYVVPRRRDDAGAFMQDLGRHVEAALPVHMRPSRMVLLEALPLTPNGKLDRNALPEPLLAQEAHLAAEGEVETTLCAIWREVLGLEQVGASDNFLALGGDSILSLQVVARARRAGLVLTPRQVFELQTVRALAAVVERAPGPVRGTARPVVGERLPLLPIQRHFFSTPIPHRAHWNQAVLLKPSELLDPATLRTALAVVVRHHEALRLRFEPAAGADLWTAVQGPLDGPELLWEQDAADEAALTARCEAAQASLDLEEGPLLRALLARLADGSQRLLLAVHHLVVDGVSWRILLEDLQAAYGMIRQGEEPRLPAPTSPLRDWAVALEAHARAGGFAREIDYWRHQLRADGIGEPPRDEPVGAGTVADAEEVEISLGRDATALLLRGAGAAYRTQINDLLLTVLARALGAWCASPSVLVELEGHGREDLFPDLDLSRTVGWFTALFPVRLTPGTDRLLADDPDAGMACAIKAVKGQLRGVPHRGLGYGVLAFRPDSPLAQAGRVEDGHAQQGQAQAALARPRVTFNYLGQFQAGGGDLFSAAGESAGRGRHREAPLGNWISLNALVLDDTLRMRFGFSRHMFRLASITAFAATYKRELEAIIAHCTDAANGGLTPSDLPLAGLDQSEIDALPVPAREIEDVYPLSPLQQGLLFEALEAPEAGRYVNQVAVAVMGLDLERFHAAWAAMTARYGALRTSFAWESPLPGPRQIVRRQVAPAVEILDWRGRAVADADLTTLAASERARGFDLARAPLQRMVVVRLDRDRSHLVWTQHHLVTDGWSGARLLEETLAHYAGAQLPAPKAGYADYIAWLGRQDPAAGEAFWRERLRAFEAPTLLADVLGVAPPARRPARGGSGRVIHRFDAAATARLVAFARGERITLNTLVQAAWALLLRGLCRQDTVVFGATFSGRPVDLPGADQLQGLLINTLPVLVPLSPACPVAELLRTLQADNLALREHEHVPLHEIQRWAGQAGQALFDTLVVFENYPVDKALRSGGGRGPVFGPPASHEGAGVPLVLAVEAGALMTIHASFQESRFTRPQVEQVLARFVHLLEQMMAQPQAALGHLDLRLPGEAGRVEAELPSGPTCAVDGRTLAEIIEAQVRAVPDRVALSFGAQQLSYGTLNRRANRLARRLRDSGAGPEVLVGVALDRSVELMVALLAVLKAGAAYVPLDPASPPERLGAMMADAGVPLVLTRAGLRAHLPEPGAGVRLWCVDEDPDGEALPQDAEQEADVPPLAGPGNLAYCIFTSGSTGRPKGAANTHAAIVNRLRWMGETYGFAATDVVLQKTPIGFDVSVWELFLPLMCGARLVLAPPGLHTDAEGLAALMRRERISIAHFVPPMLGAFLIATEGEPALTDLRLVFASGEALSADLVRRFATQQGAALHNLYGPTEAAVDVSFQACRDTPDEARVPIGRPIWNTRLLILDADLKAVPVGVPGEVHIGGLPLARGYHGRAGLTAERFVPDPFARTPGARLYRTGDLARWREDGAIDYLGRVDQQVKLRGIRIEPGEIEAALMAAAGVRAATVVARPAGGGGLHLVAYVVLRQAEPEAPARLLRTLRRSLPEAMVPAHVVVLTALPLSPNGKTDRRALPPPDEPDRIRVAPASAEERRLLALWQSVLRTGELGVTDDFFEAGGDSILAITLVARMKAAGFARVTTGHLIMNPNIRALAATFEPGSLACPGAVVLRAGGRRAPVLCLHPFQGKVESYLPFARAAAEGHPVIGFEARWLAEPMMLEDSIDAIVADYAAHVRAHVDTSDGCFVLGWSWGGLLAYELARQLAPVTRVRFVGVVDVFHLAVQMERYLSARAALEPAGDGALEERVARSPFRALWERLLARLTTQELQALGIYLRENPRIWASAQTGDPAAHEEYRTIVLFNRIHITRAHRLCPSSLVIRPWAAGVPEPGAGAVDWSCMSPHAGPLTVIEGASHSTLIRSKAFFRSMNAQMAASDDPGGG